MHESREADAFHVAQIANLRYRILLREPFPLRVIIRQCKRAIQQSIKVDLLANRLTGRRGLAFLDEVAPAKFFRRQTNRLRNFVHVPFQSKDTLWRPKASKSSVRWNVRRDRGALNPHVRTKIRSGGMNRPARQYDW